MLALLLKNKQFFFALSTWYIYSKYVTLDSACCSISFPLFTHLDNFFVASDILAPLVFVASRKQMSIHIYLMVQIIQKCLFVCQVKNITEQDQEKINSKLLQKLTRQPKKWWRGQAQVQLSGQNGHFEDRQ